MVYVDDYDDVQQFICDLSPIRGILLLRVSMDSEVGYASMRNERSTITSHISLTTFEIMTSARQGNEILYFIQEKG
jgi:hypothetical protein